MEWLLQMNGRIGRGLFALRFFGVLLVGVILGFLAYHAGYRFLHFETVGIFFSIVIGVFFGLALFAQMMRRFQDLGIPSVLFLIPVYNLYLLALLFLAPGRSQE